jgi:hypothetical protein
VAQAPNHRDDTLPVGEPARAQPHEAPDQSHSEGSKSGNGILWLLIGLFIAVVVGFGALGFYVAWQVGLWEFFKRSLSVAWLVIWTSALSLLVAYFVFHAVIGWIAWRRRPQARVFLSYQHELLETARQVAQGLKMHGIAVHLISFTPRDDEHDAVIEEVAKGIRDADVMVVVPAHKSGFFEAEILAAVVTGKPVLLVAEGDAFRLPDTAYSGYPVFTAASLAARRHEPLAQMVHIAADARPSVRAAQREVTQRITGELWVNFMLASAFVAPLLVVPVGAAMLWRWLTQGPDAAVWVLAGGRTYGIWLLVAVLIVALVISSLRAFRGNHQLREHIRQQCGARQLSNRQLIAQLAERPSMAGVLQSLHSATTGQPGSPTAL